MEKVLIFLDELYYEYNGIYYSKSNAGNFLKGLNKYYSLGYIIPVEKNVCIDDRFRSVEIDNMFNVIELPRWSSLIEFIKNYRINKKIIRSIIKRECDNYDFFWIRLPSIPGIIIGQELKKRKKKVIYHVAGNIKDAYNTGKYSGIKKILAYFVGKYVNKKMHELYDNGTSYYFCTGNNMMEEFKECNPKFFIDNEYMVDTNIILKKKKLKNVLYVGRIIEKKGIKYILDAWDAVNNEIVLNIVGSGDLENLVKEFEYKNKNIIYHGFLKGKELEEIYEKSDCLIMGSVLTEGFPRVICEAWSKGVAVVSTNVGGISYLGKDNENILYINTKDSNDIAKKINYLYENEEKLLYIKENGLKTAQSIERKNMYKLITDVINGNI